MIIIPAIDIIDGMPVRLYKGDYGKKEIVGDSIERIAEEFQKAGAEYIHLVDLDGAKSGRLKNKNIPFINNIIHMHTSSINQQISLLLHSVSYCRL